MSNTGSESGDVQELEELEPLEEAGSGGPAAAPDASYADQSLQALRAGLPVPACNPRASKEYYRFLFAGVVMTLGCLMPFGPEWTMAGYKTLSGALFLLISLGMVWSWWGAIHFNKFTGANLKWVVLALVPFIVELFNLVSAFDAPAVRDYIDKDMTVASWGELFESVQLSLFQKDAAAGLKVENFFRAFGTGKVVLFVGALLAELFFIMAIFGGAKAAKEQKMAARAASAERRRR